MRKFFRLSSFLFFLLAACQPATPPPPTGTPSLAPTATNAFTPTSTPFVLRPDLEEISAALNPLTGLAVEDASLLDIPVQLISISHFPATARPQAGLSFAPFVYEIYITEGATRFLAAFYGQYPAPEVPLTGGCLVREGYMNNFGVLLGNRVWLDANANGRAEDWEVGVGGVCINLLNADTGALIEQTRTDSNGYYAFNVEPGAYVVEFVKPEGWSFTAPNVGDENADSDADASTGRTNPIVMGEASTLTLDAGLVAPPEAVRAAQTSASLPLAQVGPVRSGRLVYADIAAFYQNSCLIYAFASEEVLAQLPKCAMVTHGIQGGGYMMELARLKEVAEDNAQKTSKTKFNYASNIYSEMPPFGGVSADRVNVFIAYLNQSGWIYDAASQSWQRYVDDSTEANAGILHADTDRLTGRQLQVQNLIVIFAAHDVISPTNLDIHLEQGESGPAILFRDGMKFDIRWSTKSTAYEKKSGLRQPMSFRDKDGAPIALRPGHTWVLVFTPYSVVKETSAGVWLLQYVPPTGAK